MPKDKDFKALVRARAAETGQKYTAARADLRPDAPSTVEDVHDHAEVRFAWLDDVAPTTVDEQRAVARPPRIERFQYQWPPTVDIAWLTVELAGEPGSELTVIDGDGLTGLGVGLGGMAFRTLGVDLVADVPGDLDGDAAEGRWAAETTQHLGRTLFGRESGMMTDADDRQPAPIFGPVGAFLVDPGAERRRLIQAGRRFLLDEAFPDLSAVAARAPERSGQLWTGFGVVLQLAGSFPVRPRDMAGRTAWGTDPVPELFDEAVEMLTGAAMEVGLPALPPRFVMLCLEADGYIGTGASPVRVRPAISGENPQPPDVPYRARNDVALTSA